jgi:hypothetical protein
MERFLNRAPVGLGNQDRIPPLPVDLHRLMGLPHLIDQGVEAPPGFRGRDSGHRDLGERTQKRTACGLVPEANDASMSPALLAGFAGGLAGPNAPGLSMLRRRQGLFDSLEELN